MNYITAKGGDLKVIDSFNPTATSSSTSDASASAEAMATNTISIEIQNILDETEMLKEDMQDERKLLLKNGLEEDEIDVSIRDIEKAEKAIQEIDEAAKNNQAPKTISKKRLERFIDDLSDEESTLNKALKTLRKGRDYAVSLAEGYNKIAENISMPFVPPLALEVIKKL